MSRSGPSSEIVAAALRIVGTCPSGCDRCCIACLQTFRNAFFHKYLDRGDKAAMVTHFARLARLLIGKERAAEVKRQTEWFTEADKSAMKDQ